MKYFSGFSLKDDKVFFDALLLESDYCVAGFSYGAIKALEYVQTQLESAKRVDTLQLFSPAFFQTKDDKFKRLQTMTYKKNEDKYLDAFIKGCFYPHERLKTRHEFTRLEDLEKLLHYEWSLTELQSLVDKGVNIEVYLGAQDIIIDVESAKELFLKVSTVTYIKKANHFLQIQKIRI